MFHFCFVFYMEILHSIIANFSISCLITSGRIVNRMWILLQYFTRLLKGKLFSLERLALIDLGHSNLF